MYSKSEPLRTTFLITVLIFLLSCNEDNLNKNSSSLKAINLEGNPTLINVERERSGNLIFSGYLTESMNQKTGFTYMVDENGRPTYKDFLSSEGNDVITKTIISDDGKIITTGYSDRRTFNSREIKYSQPYIKIQNDDGTIWDTLFQTKKEEILVDVIEFEKNIFYATGYSEDSLGKKILLIRFNSKGDITLNNRFRPGNNANYFGQKIYNNNGKLVLAAHTDTGWQHNRLVFLDIDLQTGEISNQSYIREEHVSVPKIIDKVHLVPFKWDGNNLIFSSTKRTTYTTADDDSTYYYHINTNSPASISLKDEDTKQFYKGNEHRDDFQSFVKVGDKLSIIARKNNGSSLSKGTTIGSHIFEFDLSSKRFKEVGVLNFDGNDLDLYHIEKTDDGYLVAGLFIDRNFNSDRTIVMLNLKNDFEIK